MAGVTFPYTPGTRGSRIRKPFLFGVLRHEGRFTPPVNLLVDSGSDICIFDAMLADLIGLDVASRGRQTVIAGLERDVVAWVHPIEVWVRDLRRAFWIEDAYFSR